MGRHTLKQKKRSSRRCHRRKQQRREGEPETRGLLRADDTEDEGEDANTTDDDDGTDNTDADDADDTTDDDDNDDDKDDDDKDDEDKEPNDTSKNLFSVFGYRVGRDPATRDSKTGGWNKKWTYSELIFIVLLLGSIYLAVRSRRANKAKQGPRVIETPSGDTVVLMGD